MTTNLALRIRAWRLVHRYGVTQKVLAGRMAMTTSTFNRWLHGTVRADARTNALDGLQDCMADLTAWMALDISTLTPSEQERLETEIGISEIEHKVKRRAQTSARRRGPRTGKKLASQ